MDTRKLRRIAKERGTLGVLYAGTVIAAHHIVKNKRFTLVLGGIGLAALWASSAMVTPCGQTRFSMELPPIAEAPLVTPLAAKYDVTILKPLDGGEFALPMGLNNRGAAAGISDTADGNIRGVVWANGTAKDIGSMGGSDVAAFGINDRGQVVGWAEANDTLNGFVWENGKFTNVGNLGYPLSITFGINNRSQATGISVTKDFRLRGFVWEKGKLTNIGTLPVIGPSMPSEISDNGTVTGNVYDGDGYPHPFVWSNGKINALPTGKGTSVALAINNDNFIVGVDFDDEAERVTPVIWKRGKIENLPLPRGYQFGIASDINNSGTIVGTIASERSIAPVLWDNGKIVDLNAQVGNTGVQLLFAQSINDKGDITAFGIKDEEFVAVLLTPKSRSENFEFNATNWETNGVNAPYLGMNLGRTFKDHDGIEFTTILSVSPIMNNATSSRDFLKDLITLQHGFYVRGKVKEFCP